MNQILIHNGNNNYKLPHMGKLKIENAIGSKISMRLPCRALIDGGALRHRRRCRRLTSPLLSIRDIAIAVAVTVRHRRRRPSATLPSPSPSAIAVAVIVLVLRRAVAVDHSHPLFFLIVT
jgi:hypothetical protein